MDYVSRDSLMGGGGFCLGWFLSEHRISLTKPIYQYQIKDV